MQISDPPLFLGFGFSPPPPPPNLRPQVHLWRPGYGPKMRRGSLTIFRPHLFDRLGLQIGKGPPYHFWQFPKCGRGPWARTPCAPTIIRPGPSTDIDSKFSHLRISSLYTDYGILLQQGGTALATKVNTDVITATVQSNQATGGFVGIGSNDYGYSDWDDLSIACTSLIFSCALNHQQYSLHWKLWLTSAPGHALCTSGHLMGADPDNTCLSQWGALLRPFAPSGAIGAQWRSLIDNSLGLQWICLSNDQKTAYNYLVHMFLVYFDNVNAIFCNSGSDLYITLGPLYAQSTQDKYDHQVSKALVLSELSQTIFPMKTELFVERKTWFFRRLLWIKVHSLQYNYLTNQIVERFVDLDQTCTPQGKCFVPLWPSG